MPLQTIHLSTIVAAIFALFASGASGQPSTRGSSIFSDAPFGTPATPNAKDPRGKVPDSDQIAANLKLLRELFQQDFKDTSDTGRATLARKLLAQAEKTHDDSAARYVLLDQARQLFVETEDVASVLEVIKQTAAGYQIDALDVDATAIQTIGQRTHQPQALQAVLAAGFELVEAALALDRPEVAQKVLISLDVSARSSGKPDLIAACRQQSGDLQRRLSDLQEVRDARRKLALNPADPQLNLTVGRFECFERGDWEKGLRLLQLSFDVALKALASDDLSTPAAPATQFDLAGSWWTWAQSQKGHAQQSAQDRSRHWYRIALPQLTGLKKALAQQRLASAPASKLKTLLDDVETASSIIFLCDASGSMIEKMPILRAEVQKRVDRLRETQRFNIALFADGDRKPQVVWPSFMPADANHKSAATQFLDTIAAAGSTDPTGTIEWAMKQHPRLIILFTDGDFPDSNKLLTNLKELNRGHQTTISTVSFVSGRDRAADPSFAAVLKQIAQDHGGTYAQVPVSNN